MKCLNSKPHKLVIICSLSQRAQNPETAAQYRLPLAGSRNESWISQLQESLQKRHLRLHLPALMF